MRPLFPTLDPAVRLVISMRAYAGFRSFLKFVRTPVGATLTFLALAGFVLARIKGMPDIGKVIDAFRMDVFRGTFFEFVLIAVLPYFVTRAGVLLTATEQQFLLATPIPRQQVVLYGAIMQLAVSFAIVLALTLMTPRPEAPVLMIRYWPIIYFFFSVRYAATCLFLRTSDRTFAIAQFLAWLPIRTLYSIFALFIIAVLAGLSSKFVLQFIHLLGSLGISTAVASSTKFLFEPGIAPTIETFVLGLILSLLSTKLAVEYLDFDRDSYGLLNERTLKRRASKRGEWDRSESAQSKGIKIPIFSFAGGFGVVAWTRIQERIRSPFGLLFIIFVFTFIPLLGVSGRLSGMSHQPSSAYIAVIDSEARSIFSHLILVVGMFALMEQVAMWVKIENWKTLPISSLGVLSGHWIVPVFAGMLYSSLVLAISASIFVAKCPELNPWPYASKLGALLTLSSFFLTLVIQGGFLAIRWIKQIASGTKSSLIGIVSSLGLVLMYGAAVAIWFSPIYAIRDVKFSELDLPANSAILVAGICVIVPCSIFLFGKIQDWQIRKS